MKKLTNKKGFTLIEIVIVLAIAALILVAIFIAVRGAQQSRRDAQRRDDAAVIGSLLEESAGNRRGNYPTAAGGLTLAQFTTVVAARTQTPDNTEYTLTAVGAIGTCPAPGTGAVNDSQVTVVNRNWQVATRLESGDWFCTTNS